VLVVVCGVAGSGKTTIGTLLAQRLAVSYADADDFHSESNRRKMAAGLALSDADRRPWLAAIAAWLDARIASGEPGVVSCSALKREYRDLLREGRPSVRLVFLHVEPEVIARRLAARHGHFFPDALAASQFQALEAPAEDEPILLIDASPPPDAVVDAVIAAL